MGLNGSVILVDRHDRIIGIEEKMRAHSRENGRLHRAISIFVFNGKGETLLQQRSMSKYHSKGRWSNTCCSHPMPGEKVITAAHRRLMEEMGFDCRMIKAFEFPYEADVGSGLREREYDHVIFGRYDGKPLPNRSEVKDWRWIDLASLRKELRRNPGKFTPWLRLMMDKIIIEYKRRQAALAEQA